MFKKVLNPVSFSNSKTFVSEKRRKRFETVRGNNRRFEPLPKVLDIDLNKKICTNKSYELSFLDMIVGLSYVKFYLYNTNRVQKNKGLFI